MFLDTEFIDQLGLGIHLISIGVVCEDGREYYKQSTVAPWDRASSFVRHEVIPKLDHRDPAINPVSCDLASGHCLPGFTSPCPWSTPAKICKSLTQFFEFDLHNDVQNRLWMDGGCHDAYLLTVLFGGYDKMPPSIPNKFSDIDVFKNLKCNHKVRSVNNRRHHALHDARQLCDDVTKHRQYCEAFRELSS